MEGLLAMWNMTEPVIIVLVEENPKKAGVAARDLRHDQQHDFIKFVTPADFKTKKDPD